ncbi:MAG: hypothetical protein ABI411_10955 [Tahibacter sp.]
MRDTARQQVISAIAADGYRAVVTVSGLDPTIGAHRENGNALPRDDGPWQAVVVSDQRPARWVRQGTGVVVYDRPESAYCAKQTNAMRFAVWVMRLATL